MVKTLQTKDGTFYVGEGSEDIDPASMLPEDDPEVQKNKAILEKDAGEDTVVVNGQEFKGTLKTFHVGINALTGKKVIKLVLAA